MQTYKQVRPKDSKIGNLFKDKVGFEFTIPNDKKIDRSSLKVHINIDLMFLIRKTYMYTNQVPADVPETIDYLAPYVKYLNIVSNPTDSFFKDCEVKINDTRVSFTDNYHLSSYIKTVLSETEQKNIRNNCLNPVNQLESGKENDYIKAFTSLGINNVSPFDFTKVTALALQPKVDLNAVNNNVELGYSFIGDLNALICGEDLPGNIKVNIDFNVNSEYLKNLLYTVPIPGGIPAPEGPIPTQETDGAFYNITKSEFAAKPIAAVDTYLVNATMKDIFITYNEYDYAPMYKRVVIPFTEMYSTTIQIPEPAANVVFPYKFFNKIVIPHDISGFAVVFNAAKLEDEQSATNSNYNKFDLVNYQFKYGNTLYPLTTKSYNFKREVGIGMGIRQDNNSAFKEYTNQISAINESNGSLLNAKQWSMNPVLYYIVRRPENDTSQSFEITLNIQAQTQAMEMVLIGFYHNECFIEYNDAHIVQKMTIDEL